MTVPALNRNGLNLVTTERPLAVPIAFGPQGPQGEVGPPGPIAGRYNHVQASPAMTWTVNHNLGMAVSVAVFSIGGMEVEAEVVNVSQNQVQILFVTPTAGSAVIT